mmetsp:Transcript_44877/g.129786  ORF Transcript_44877/g.129786 Transcript_44877/m.129786 type:complete len:205 (+) Transcript_44877:865-1479(+)
MLLLSRPLSLLFLFPIPIFLPLLLFFCFLLSAPLLLGAPVLILLLPLLLVLACVLLLLLLPLLLLVLVLAPLSLFLPLPLSPLFLLRRLVALLPRALRAALLLRPCRRPRCLLRGLWPRPRRQRRRQLRAQGRRDVPRVLAQPREAQGPPVEAQQPQRWPALAAVADDGERGAPRPRPELLEAPHEGAERVEAKGALGTRPHAL